jgi:hypothetical protein
MSKIIPLHAPYKDTWPVGAAAISTGWMPGQAGKLNSTGDSAILAVADATMFILMDATTELSAPPTGSLVTGFYGSGSKFLVDHSAEVAASSNARAYESDVESAPYNADLYISANSKWTSTATGSVKGKLYQIPTLANNYNVGIILRF